MRYRERLSVPAYWWVLNALFAGSLLLAIGFFLGPVWAVGVALACFAVTTALFLTAAVSIGVTDSALTVGRAVIEHRYLGEVIALDAAEARRRRGPGADARAYLVLRPYVASAVEIAVVDPADPVPYWLVATRHPRALAAALTEAAARELH
ncbi:MAG TPA: DUF3093 domain-containing protein [Propionibacteriaceae bacterium]|nr:DUF3093 domain-containing protein [Propionibacteriaceae bacterium]